jgi:hypothetical protein
VLDFSPEPETNRRIIHVDSVHVPDPARDNPVETRFDADGTGTLMTMRMTRPDAETRAATWRQAWSVR